VSSCYLPPIATINNIQLPVADTFCYLGSRVTYRNTLDDELTARVAKAGAAFGQLSKRLWSDHGVRLETKIQVYCAAILSSLLYGSETWTPYRRHIKKLDNFHMNCLCRILNVQWQDRIPNTEILNRCEITGVEVMIMQSQQRWCGHVHRMLDSRIPKQLLYGQLAEIGRSQGSQRKRYKHYLCLTLKSCDISNSSWESVASDRLQWRHLWYNSKISVSPAWTIVVHAGRTKQGRQIGLNIFSCMTCGRTCTSQIGMYARQKQCNSTSAMDR